MNRLLKFDEGKRVVLAHPFARPSKDALIFEVVGIPAGTPNAEILRIINGTWLHFYKGNFEIPVQWDKCGIGTKYVVMPEE